MAIHSLTTNFTSFFKRLNPGVSFEQKAASEHKTITGLIEDRRGLAGVLSPTCFLQGSYKQDTAIYSINDVDIVVLCELWQPGSGAIGVKSWTRDEIFSTIAAPLLNDNRYRTKVRYNANSMCIKVDLGIKVEILPVVFKAGTQDRQQEPFRLYRPEKGQWEDGFARFHQVALSWKNRSQATSGNFIPAVKVLKHLRTHFGLDAVSFHIECLLHSLADQAYAGGPADYIPTILESIAGVSATDWYARGLMTPCGERNIFVASEWTLDGWQKFHEGVVLWRDAARFANQSLDRSEAIDMWQRLLGDDFFPKEVQL